MSSCTFQELYSRENVIQSILSKPGARTGEMGDSTLRLGSFYGF